MIVIICIDDKNGMMFNNRRQSQDSKVREDIVHEIDKSKLWMNEYSAKQFKNDNLKDVVIDENFMDKADLGYCFVENISLLPYEQQIEQLIIYRWNRCYPADFYFNIDITKSDWKLVKQEKLVGTSHDNITKEVYIQKN